MTLLKGLAFGLLFLVVDVAIVFLEFAGSRWLLPYLIQFQSFAFWLAAAMVPLLVFRATRYAAGCGISVASAYLLLRLAATCFVVEADLGGLMGPIVALFSAGAAVIPLVVVTMIVQAEWVLLRSFFVNVAIAAVVMALGAWALSSGEGD